MNLGLIEVFAVTGILLLIGGAIVSIFGVYVLIRRKRFFYLGIGAAMACLGGGLLSIAHQASASV